MGSCPDTDIDPFLLPQGSVILYRLGGISCFSGGTERGLVVTNKELMGGGAGGYGKLIESDAGGGESLENYRALGGSGQFYCDTTKIFQSPQVIYDDGFFMSYVSRLIL